MIECQTCYKLTESSSKFCQECGARINLKNRSKIKYTKPKVHDSRRKLTDKDSRIISVVGEIALEIVDLLD